MRLALLALLLALAGCAPYPHPIYPGDYPGPRYCRGCGDAEGVLTLP